MPVVPQQFVLVAAVKRGDVNVAVCGIGGNPLRESHSIREHREGVHVAVDEQPIGVTVREDRTRGHADREKQWNCQSCEILFHVSPPRVGWPAKKRLYDLSPCKHFTQAWISISPAPKERPKLREPRAGRSPARRNPRPSRLGRTRRDISRQQAAPGACPPIAARR